MAPREVEKGKRTRKYDLEDYEYGYYKGLKDGSIKINVSDHFFMCPFCSNRDRRRKYTLKELLHHASRLSRTSPDLETSVKEQARHLALDRYLRRYPVEKNLSGSPSRIRCSTTNKDQLFVWPSMGIIANITTALKDGKRVAESGRNLREELKGKGFNPVRVHPLWNRFGHTGFAIVEFTKDWVGFRDAMKFDLDFQANNGGKRDYYVAKDRGDKLFGWIARDDDYYSGNQIGRYLKDNGDLKSVSSQENDEKCKTNRLYSDLKSTLAMKKVDLLEMKNKYRKTTSSLQKLADEKDLIIEVHNAEMRKMEEIARNQLDKIVKSHEKFRQRLQAQKDELRQKEELLEKREAHDENKRRKLEHDRETIYKAIQEQQKADENVLKLAEQQKREKEVLHQKIITLEKELDAKQSLELEIERLKGHIEVMKHIKDDEDDAGKKMKEMTESLEEKEQQLDHLDMLSQMLIVKERKVNEELQDARKELISAFVGVTSRSLIGVKRMGALDSKPFLAAAKMKLIGEEADVKAMELCSLWESYLGDPSWHPFKTIRVGEDYEEIIDVNDEKLQELKKEYGDEPFEAVTTAIKELNQYNPSGRYPLPELWNREQGRKATLTEGVTLLLKQWKSLKRKKA